jgi:hypothetical protein
MPQRAAAPPLAIEDFPGEYKTISAKSLKRRRLSGSLGMLQISAAESSPLNLFSSTRPSTSAILSINFEPMYPDNFDIKAFEWSFAVKSYLRIRIFYSTQKLTRVPTFTAARSNSHLGVRDTEMAAEVREFIKPSWRKIVESSQSTKERHCWLATLAVPINTSKTLLPTFINVLSALRYTLVLRFSVKGLYHGTLQLILPVQVIYDPLQGRNFEAGEGLGDENGNEISLSISQPPDYALAQEVSPDLGILMSIQDHSPPPYDL